MSSLIFSTKDVVRTSVLSTRWRNLSQRVVGLDLKSCHFQNFSKFVSFTDRFFNYHRDSLISKVCLIICGNLIITPRIDLVTARRIQHLDIYFAINYTFDLIPLSLYTCETLVHLRLQHVLLVNTEFVSLPCLKIMDLEVVSLSQWGHVGETYFGLFCSGRFEDPSVLC